jgi:hypothetical protein
MAPHKGRGILFGGVYDQDESEEDLSSIFYNDLYPPSKPVLMRGTRIKLKATAILS